MSEVTIDNEFLSSYSMFGGLEDWELDLVQSFLTNRLYEAGATILHQGEQNSSVFFIVDGEVAVIRQSEAKSDEQRQIATLKTGDSFGEMELIDINRCAATIVTTVPTRVITLSNAHFYQISLTSLRTYTMLMLNLARDISRRLRAADELLALINVH
ncbi:MAG: cyclic nucleotide-binding domain-containing protein [Sphaerochaeta sp.]|jgi:CRP-like cAMP-binding protein|nr:cyclic nucleotide-binding domain-containing protein [Sphaerochaeta sp.]MDX9915075.1 cyclic nucleotide-binding domain-containing protein [Sphaerochaeta sp.]